MNSTAILIADSANNRIQILGLTTGMVNLVAGSHPGFKNGPALQAAFYGPYGVAYNAAAGVAYITDNNQVIRMLNLTSGIVSTLAGTGTFGYINGPASSAEFNTPTGIAFDPSNGNIYVADTYNFVIRLINTGTGIVSTLAGSGSSGYLDGPASSAQFNGPRGIALDSSNGNIYVSDSQNNAIRLINSGTGMVSTIAGNGTSGYLDGPASSAQFNFPIGIALDSSNGNVIVSDSLFIRLVDITSNSVSTLAGNGFSSFANGPVSIAEFNDPNGIALDSSNGNIYVADSSNSVIRLINTGTGMVSTIAGSRPRGYLDGPASSAKFNFPNGIALDSSNRNIYVTDSSNNVIRLINTGTGIVSTIAGTGSYGYLDGPASSAKFNFPNGIALDSSSGNIYVADSGNKVIRLINATTGMVSTFAGNGTLGFSNGPALQAEFNFPFFVTFDPSNGNVIVSDTSNNRIALSKTILSF